MLSVLFWDPTLAAVTAALLTAMALDTVSALLRSRRLLETYLNPSAISLRVQTGESRTIEIEALGPVEMELEGGDWYSASYLPSKSLIVVEVKPQLSGVYVLESLRAKVEGRLRLMKASASLPVRIEVKAYPRVFPWILEIARMLGTGLAWQGIAPGRRTGWGDEYYGIREYIPGDSLRLVEWKATARHSKLMVKEYLEEISSSFLIVYDERAPGPITADELAAIFLSSVVGAASTGAPISLMIKSGEGSELYLDGLGPRETLETALAHVLERVEAEMGGIYELLEPQPSGELVAVLERTRRRGIARILAARRRQQLGKRLRLAIRRPGPALDLIYIGHVLYDTSDLLELVWEARVKGHRLLIRTPAKPWRDSRSLEEAYIIYTSLEKVLNAIKRTGAEVVIGSPHPLQIRVFS
jgi:uncharacterized protein (DUF58 family)